jgi:cellobiose phosphorylase
MQYGYFDDEAHEYVITEPRAPVKWINYVGTLAFGGFVDHTGGALICKGDPALNRITRYLAWLPASAFKGTTLYLRLTEAGGYRLLSPFFVPGLEPLDRFECHVGLGYARIISELCGLRTDATFFVPPDSPPGDASPGGVEPGRQLILDVRLTNLSGRPIEVDAIPLAEYTHFDALKQLTNADWVPQTMQSRAHHEEGGLKTLLQYAFMRRDTAVNYVTSNLPASSFETDRARFLGGNEYGTWAQPLSLQQPELGNYEARRGDNVAALLHHLGTVQQGGTARLIVQMGQAASLEAALPSIHEFRDEGRVDAAFEQLRHFWDRYLARIQVETPDANMNRMLNVHNPRQCYVTFNWSRYLSLYQLGYGARGMGFRDSSQDAMGIMAHAPTEARRLLTKLLRVQRADGSAMHQFNPLTMVANTGEARTVEDGPQYYGDDHLWIVLAVCAYLKETGDLAFLDTIIPFYSDPAQPARAPIESGTVREHLRRALAFTTSNVGAHGLPLLGFADWNDTVNLAAGAESLFLANLYGRALREMIELARHLGEPSEEYAAWYREMLDRVNEHGWDGEWYVRYFDAAGRPLGSRENSHGQIYANGQSWPVLSGFAPAERARAGLQAVHDRLNTAFGIKLSAPGYDGYDAAVGGISTYPPGAKENGGIFLHANPWVIMAEATMGNGDRAYRYYDQINPAARNDDVDRFQCEPYAYPQNILGDEHPQFGLARNSWLTGAASWSYQAATQYLLGIRPTYDGLQVDPCIPAGWPGFRVTRHFRGAIYHIEVHNPHGICQGVCTLEIDGQSPIEGSTIPLLPPNHTCHVRATLSLDPNIQYPVPNI